MKLEFLEAGEIVTTHGVRGEVKVLPWADGPEFLLGFKRVRIGNTEYKIENSFIIPGKYKNPTYFSFGFPDKKPEGTKIYIDNKYVIVKMNTIITSLHFLLFNDNNKYINMTKRIKKTIKDSIT